MFVNINIFSLGLVMTLGIFDTMPQIENDGNCSLGFWPGGLQWYILLKCLFSYIFYIKNNSIHYTMSEKYCTIYCTIKNSMSAESVILNAHNNSHWYWLNFENVTQFSLLNLTVTATYIILMLTVFYIHQISRVVPVLLSPVIKNRVRVKVIYVCYTNKICLYQSYGVKRHFILQTISDKSWQSVLLMEAIRVPR